MVRHKDQTIGVELAQDIEEINLDSTLTDLQKTKEYLNKILQELGNQADLKGSIDNLFNRDAFEALVLASGGVVRDFLNIFVESIDSSISNKQTHWLTPTYIWKGAGRLSYRTKLNNLKNDAGHDSSQLEIVFNDLVKFCLKEKRKTVFLISQIEVRDFLQVHEYLLQLMDFKLIHVIEPDTSAASGRTGRFEAYTLDFSLFMEPRLRNIDHVEFWKIGKDRNRIGVREAPDYPLKRARDMLNSDISESLDSIIKEIDADNVNNYSDQQKELDLF